MGNERSQPAGLVIEENAIEVTDRWSLHSATHLAGGNPKISVFAGVSGSQSDPSLLENFAKNLMIHRHPCVLKYVATWKKGCKSYLATEDVRPLTQVLANQTALQVCIGLQSVLKALTFLHEKAQSSHNNVCQAAVYVTADGTWKLGGLEYLCRFSDLSSGYLNSARNGRYEKGVAPGEGDRLPQPPSAIDRFAFGILVEEVLKAYSSDDVPGMEELKEVSRHQLQNRTPASRPSLLNVLEMPFFSHEFISIHNFLVELTLKNEQEKQDFFKALTEKLSSFPEEVVASQLGSLLLSRMVLVDLTAQQHLLPQIFIPRLDDGAADEKGRSLFSESTFKAHLVPKLLPMFCVRDTHVRLTLLAHFTSFCSMFLTSQLQSHILPELLVGIKDTNDELVSCTLRALADLIPILGSSVVIGGKGRAKYFTDGRPKQAPRIAKSNGRRSTKSSKTDADSSAGPAFDIFLPERASPDGGEDFVSPAISEEEAETWTDWENNIEETTTTATNNTTKEQNFSMIDVEPQFSCKQNQFNSLELNSKMVTAVEQNRKTSSITLTGLPDITSLDVKVSASVKEIDYFQDMEPVISTNHIVEINTEDGLQPTPGRSKFEIDHIDGGDDCTGGGWGDDSDNWADFNNSDNLSIIIKERT